MYSPNLKHVSEASTTDEYLDIYDQFINDNCYLDWSSLNLKTVPSIENNMLCALFLSNNNITHLPEDFFPSLRNLMWLDVRGNQLTSLPTTIGEHYALSHLLLQDNKISSLPNELGTVHHLKVLQLSGNPLVYPPKEILECGIETIMPFLLEKYYDALFEHVEIGSAEALCAEKKNLMKGERSLEDSATEVQKLNISKDERSR